MELSEWLTAYNVTLAEFGSLAGGVEASTVMRWRDGGAWPTPENMRLIEAATLGTVTYADFQVTRDRRKLVGL